MQNQIQIFENKEFGKLEVLMLDGKPYFPATECARVLGYSNPHEAIRTHCKGVRKTLTPTRNQHGATVTQKINYIPEGDLYRLIIRSKLPAAVRFEAWVCDCVLPTIRKHGAYISPEILERMQGDQAFADSLVQCLSAEQAKNTALTETVERMLPKTVYYDNILQTPNAMPVSIIAKDYGMSAIAFNKLLHEMKVQYRVGTTWLLYKKYANKGYVLSKTYIFDGESASVYTCWTQRGRQFLYELLKWYGILPLAERPVV